jgi:hypothetical protein
MPVWKDPAVEPGRPAQGLVVQTTSILNSVLERAPNH